MHDLKLNSLFDVALKLGDRDSYLLHRVSIGKRYRRQDEVGTPLCITYDFDSEVDNCVTVRDRDTMEQVRIPISELRAYIEKVIEF